MEDIRTMRQIKTLNTFKVSNTSEVLYIVMTDGRVFNLICNYKQTKAINCENNEVIDVLNIKDELSDLSLIDDSF